MKYFTLPWLAGVIVGWIILIMIYIEYNPNTWIMLGLVFVIYYVCGSLCKKIFD